MQTILPPSLNLLLLILVASSAIILTLMALAALKPAMAKALRIDAG